MFSLLIAAVLMPAMVLSTSSPPPGHTGGHHHTHRHIQDPPTADPYTKTAQNGPYSEIAQKLLTIKAKLRKASEIISHAKFREECLDAGGEVDEVYQMFFKSPSPEPIDQEHLEQEVKSMRKKIQGPELFLAPFARAGLAKDLDKLYGFVKDIAEKDGQEVEDMVKAVRKTRGHKHHEHGTIHHKHGGHHGQGDISRDLSKATYPYTKITEELQDVLYKLESLRGSVDNSHFMNSTWNATFCAEKLAGDIKAQGERMSHREMGKRAEELVGFVNDSRSRMAFGRKEKRDVDAMNRLVEKCEGILEMIMGLKEQPNHGGKKGDEDSRGKGEGRERDPYAKLTKDLRRVQLKLETLRGSVDNSHFMNSTWNASFLAEKLAKDITEHGGQNMSQRDMKNMASSLVAFVNGSKSMLDSDPRQKKYMNDMNRVVEKCVKIEEMIRALAGQNHGKSRDHTHHHKM